MIYSNFETISLAMLIVTSRGGGRKKTRLKNVIAFITKSRWQNFKITKLNVGMKKFILL